MVNRSAAPESFVFYNNEKYDVDIYIYIFMKTTIKLFRSSCKKSTPIKPYINIFTHNTRIFDVMTDPRVGIPKK